MSIGFKIYLILEILTIILQGKSRYQCQYVSYLTANEAIYVEHALLIYPRQWFTNEGIENFFREKTKAKQWSIKKNVNSLLHSELLRIELLLAPRRRNFPSDKVNWKKFFKLILAQLGRWRIHSSGAQAEQEQKITANFFNLHSA